MKEISCGRRVSGIEKFTAKSKSGWCQRESLLKIVSWMKGERKREKKRTNGNLAISPSPLIGAKSKIMELENRRLTDILLDRHEHVYVPISWRFQTLTHKTILYTFFLFFFPFIILWLTILIVENWVNATFSNWFLIPTILLFFFSSSSSAESPESKSLNRLEVAFQPSDSWFSRLKVKLPETKRFFFFLK